MMRKWTMFSLGFVIAILLMAFNTYAQKVTLTTGVLNLKSPSPAAQSVNLFSNQNSTDFYYFAAAFEKALTSNQLGRLSAEGTLIQEKIAPGIYLIQSREVPTDIWCLNRNIVSIGILPASLKLDPRIFKENIPGYALIDKDRIKVQVGIYGSMTPQLLFAQLASAGLQDVKTAKTSRGVIYGNIDKAALNKLAALPYVYFIQLAKPEDKALNEIGRLSSGTILPNAALSAGGKNLLGQGITVGVGDDADPTLHIDVSDRVVNHTPGIPNNHGTHVTGTLAGAGIRNFRAAGFAPQAQIISQWFAGIWTNAKVYTQQYNMVVTNNSYGGIVSDCDYAGIYDLDSRLLDLQAFDLPQLLHVFAAGNDGDATCAPFPQAFQTVLGGYQSAKNVITVGRTDYTQIASSSSAGGPVKDGRLKPEITGLGIIRSLNGNGTGYYTDFGTSMSAPNITGGLALLYQRYRQLFGGINPPGTLMKALILNGARDVGIPGPDYRHGYGTMMLERSLRILENNRFSNRTITQAAVQDTIIQVPAGLSQLKVMIVWHDPAANILAANTLVNDLDLEVIAPGGATVFPKILNPASGFVNQPATEGADHTNNQEQIVIDNPVPGNYTIRVRGFEVLANPTQAYSLVYDFLPSELRFTSPVSGSAIAAGANTMTIAWEDTDNGNPATTYNLDYSPDNGSNWVNIVSGLKDTTRLYFWQPGDIRSGQARLRLTKGSVTAISNPFGIVPNITFTAAATADQCYGYFRINWTSLTPQSGETIDYIIRLKKGAAMENIATVSGANTYTIAGLNPDSTYFAAVVARINGQEGRYENAITRRPNTGTCNGAISDGDLMVDSITAPQTGRSFTSTQPGNAAVQVRIRNLDNVATTGFSIRYNINAGVFTQANITTPVAARATYLHTFTAVDFSTPGTYNLMAIVQNTSAIDPVASNDTFRLTIRHLPNPVLNVTTPFLEDFESATIQTSMSAAMGYAGLNRWDYVNQDPLARARSFVTSDIPFSGQRAISMDVSKAPPRVTNPFNQLIGTFNLSDYQAANHEIRLSFHFLHHGETQGAHPQNKVWIRGNDTQDWLELYDLGANQTPLGGNWQKVSGLPVNDILKNAGQEFSSSTQIRFGQYALFSMADKFSFGGYSFDDVGLMIAQNDVSVKRILQPAQLNCGLGSNETIQIELQNNMPQPLTNIPVRFRVNGGPWINAIVPSLPAKSTQTFNFTTPADLSAFGKITLEANANLAGDNIPENNTATLILINQPTITSYPYFQDFESGSGGYVSEGINNTWELGTPASFSIKSAAGGTNAWKTRLIGNYENSEFSYLYSPCFNISTLSTPLLNFNLAYALEDCRRFDVVCDAAWVEYSADNGANWKKLGAFGEGENWYDYEAGQVWMKDKQSDWKEAMIPLPVTNGIIRFRFVLQSDGGSTREGIAIDNIRIFNGGPLSVNWVLFEAQKNNNQGVDLRWIVREEQAGDRFEIQVASDASGQDFKTIGELAAGNNTNSYRFTDNNPYAVISRYYRIVWYKPNGDALISPVRRITREAPANQWIVFPNPATHSLQVQASLTGEEFLSVRILSMDGKLLYTNKAAVIDGQLNTQINLNQLTPGMYMIELQGQQHRMIRKFIRQ